MGSRLKENPDRTFNWFFEATCPITRDKDPGLSFQFPEDFSDKESREELPRFCFPYDIQRVKDRMAVQHFCFVLTDLEGCQRFGFCRLNNNTQTCLCILSYLPWFEVFYKLLNNLADYLTKGQTNEMRELLAGLYKQPMPLPAGSVTLQMGKQLLVGTEVSWPGHAPDGQDWVPYFIAPDPRSLPSIPESRNLTELVVTVDVGNLLQLYASMLFERRILLFASKLSTLTACAHALSGVLYPMYWQHIFIPVLPPHLLDYCCAPMPYLIGVHASLSERVRSRGLEEVVILNVDTNTLENPFDDLKRIPTDVMAGLKALLKRQTAAAGCGVAKAFLRAQAMLFGGYKDALQNTKEGEMWFSEELFLVHKSPAMTQFLQGAVHLQFFKQFIDERLELLNKGEEPDDLFEEEIHQCKTGGTTSYQQLVGNLKRGGGALILNMRSKANMKAKGFTKRGLKNLLIHKDHSETHALQRGGSVSFRRAQSDCLQNRLPITQHFGMSRPRRPAHKHRAGEEETTEEDTRDAWDGAVTRPAAERDSDLQKDEEDDEDSQLCDPEEMDLLGEIFETLSSRTSHECGLLYGTRSLDLFGLDSHDYITKVPYRKKSLVTPSQESLSLSIGGSDSLHSWNLEEGLQATEAESEVTEDSDCLSLDACVPEWQQEEPESLLVAGEPWMEETGPKECREEGKVKGKREEVTEVPMSWKKEEINNRSDSKRVISEEVKETGQQDMKVGAEELMVQGKIEEQESNGLGANEAEDRGSSEEVRGGAEAKRGTENAVQRQNDLLREQNEEKGVTGSLSRNSGTGDTQHDYHPNTVDVVVVAVEQHQWQDDTANLDTTASPQPQNLAADPDSKTSSVKEKRDVRQRENEEQEMERISCPPRVPAVTRFQSKSFRQILENRSQASSLTQSERSLNTPRGRENLQNSLSKESIAPSVKDDLSENTKEEVLQPVKVSELKKRFEAELLGN